ncbi:putative 2OG-Fe(II) oxygenase [Roseibium album]|uniref:putative 2OG-Fe(II) oxygenase n=1 Tax=Roseibium album TaxID=311410 RepID=UPI0024909083|nr:putative 2OG-Fe(II) oxygenase [Roseibium album]
MSGKSLTPSASHLFDVPFFTANLDDAVDRLGLLDSLRYIREHDASETKLDYRVGLSNTGWHSTQWTEDTAPKQVGSLIPVFRQMLHQAIECLLEEHLGKDTRVIEFLDGEMTLWAVINGDGDINLRHVHVSPYRDTWSMVYYVDVPEDLNGGQIRFFNPNLAYRCSIGSTLARYGAATIQKTIAPRSGDLFIFPGWLEHDVLPFWGRHERTVLAANIGIRSLQLSRAKIKPKEA